MKRLLLTGFEPFRQRPVNASWIAAQALARAWDLPFEARAWQVPVVWDQPGRVLQEALAQWPAQAVLAMGEGDEGGFRLEIRARRQRKEAADNQGCLPQGRPVCEQGPDLLESQLDCQALAQSLAAQGIPVSCSEDAGAYLCEELLYHLENRKRQDPQLEWVLFVHLPPYGSPLQYLGESRHCDRSLLLDFGSRLLALLAAPPDEK